MVPPPLVSFPDRYRAHRPFGGVRRLWRPLKGGPKNLFLEVLEEVEIILHRYPLKGGPKDICECHPVDTVVNPLIRPHLLFHHARGVGLEAPAPLVYLLAVKAPLVAPVLAGEVRPPPMLHLRLREPIDELVNYVPLDGWAQHLGQTRHQLGKCGDPHDRIASGPLGLIIGFRVGVLVAAVYLVFCLHRRTSVTSIARLEAWDLPDEEPAATDASGSAVGRPMSTLSIVKHRTYGCLVGMASTSGTGRLPHQL